jgi:hypothetical protein
MKVGFLLDGLLRSLSPFPLLIPAVMKLLIGGLFLHAPIMSQIPVNSSLTDNRVVRL